MPFIPSGIQRTSTKVKLKKKKGRKRREPTTWELYTARRGPPYQRGTALGAAGILGGYLAAAGAPRSGLMFISVGAAGEASIYAGEQLNKLRKKEKKRLLALRKKRKTRAKRKR